jgi:hypothetical protein
VNPLLVLAAGAAFVYFGICNRSRWQGLGLIAVGTFLVGAALMELFGGGL